jgi:Tfp pilus assembly protein PilO
MKIESFLRKYFLNAFVVLLLLIIIDFLILSFGVLKLDAKAKQLESQVKKGEETLSLLQKKVEDKENEVNSFKESKAVIETIKDNIFEKRVDRFINFQKEVEKLVLGAQMNIEKYDYKYDIIPKDIEKEGWKDGFVQVSMVLPLQGSYPQIKNFVSSVENSGHFFTINGIDISQSTQGSALLNFKIGISTFFVYDPKEDKIEDKK